MRNHLLVHRIIPRVIFLHLLISIFGCQPGESDRAYPIQVPEGFEITEVISSDSIAFPMFGSFDNSGRLFVFEATEINNMGTELMEAEPSYQIRLLEDTDGNGDFDHSVIYASKLPFPMGGTFYQGSLFVAASPDLLKLTDLDGDGVADRKEKLLTGWTLNQNGAILSGPFMGCDGWLYLADARRGFEIRSKEGTIFKGQGARIWRCLPDGSQLDWVSGGGFDNSIEIVFMPTGETLGTMTYFTDPKDGKRDALMHWVEGGVYPKYHHVIDSDNLPRTGDLMPVMTEMPRIAPSGLMRYKGNAWGPQYAGNLFSAEFNTGRVMRYNVFADGATYRTEDETFISSESSDVHLTDVLQDADGSLLVIATGGWFIEGCPLSRVAKPEVRGGIYRVQKINRHQLGLNEAWAREVNFDLLPPFELEELLRDSRFRVVEKALEALVEKGESSIPLLKSHLSGEPAEIDPAIVFALYKIGGESALQAIREALSNSNDDVKVAAARCLGLALDAPSSHALIALLNSESLPVQRQVATALGQIGDPRAVQPLLHSLDHRTDRMTEHAVIFSLIQIGAVAPLKDILESGTSQMQSAALIAIDQIKHDALKAETIIPLLSSTHSGLRETATWILERHPEWSNTIARFLDSTLSKSDTMQLDKMGIGRLLLAFRQDPEVQRLISHYLGSDYSTSNRLYLLDIIEQSDMGDFPLIWKNKLEQLLSDPSLEMKLQVLKLIISKELLGFDQALNEIIAGSTYSDELCLMALHAKSLEKGPLTQFEWSYLVQIMTEKRDPYLIRPLLHILRNADLSEGQLLYLANIQLVNIDRYLVRDYLEFFEGAKSETVGEALLESLEKVVDSLDHIAPEKLVELTEAYPVTIRQRAKAIVAKLQSKQEDQMQKLVDLNLNLGAGDVGRGRTIFYGKGICSTCHAVGGVGSDFGPDLSNIGEIRSKRDLLEAIILPNASFARDYETYRITTAKSVHLGILVDEFGEILEVSTGPGTDIRLKKSEILSMTRHNESLMPSGLTSQLSETELADLLTYLQALPYRIDRLLDLNESGE